MVDHRTARAQGKGPVGVLAALVGVCLLAASPMLLYRSVASITRSQQQVLQALQQSLEEVKVERDTARTYLDEVKTQLEELQGSMEVRVRQLANLSEVAEDIKFDLNRHNSQFSPADRISEQPAAAIVRIDSKGQYVASPSLVRLPGGRLLVALERAVTWGQTKETTMKLIYSSEDGGSSWQRAAVVGPMNWPQIFSCASGTYLMGTERHFSHNNNLVISKMLDDKGASWSVPTKLTKGLSVVSANTGVDVSGGRVTKAFEVIPSMAEPLASTKLTKARRASGRPPLPCSGGGCGDQGRRGCPTWEHQPVLELDVESTAGFILYTLVKVPYGDKALFFRIAKIDAAAKRISARLERFNMFWQKEPLSLAAQSTLQVASGAQIYGGVDWVATAMNADETADLRDPEAWHLSEGVGNPASMYSHEMRALFDAAFRGDSSVRKSIIGFDVPGLDTSSAWEAGFGSLYWMEGVVTRLQDKHGGNNKLLSIMRVNNDILCDLAALVEFDDASVAAAAAANASAASARLAVRFLRYAFIPGLGVGHPAILFDAVSCGGGPVTLRYGGSGTVVAVRYMAWCKTREAAAGDGRDLLVVSRAAFAPWARDSDAVLNDYYNNHNSNTIAFHRVKNFRHYANVEWVRYQGPYSRYPRRTAMKDEVESAEAKAFAAGVAERQKAADAAAAADAKAKAAGGGDGVGAGGAAAAGGGGEQLAGLDAPGGTQQQQPAQKGGGRRRLQAQ
ncbi:expressed protein [Chlorella variabilis]|uniref:Expressed protein n=1 Tax=Chlorella variabilis TaxID=554065 RepID=E1ZL84_CHLVA|nr:expressed protein [Chlorella variabilis]EFN53516.1 expressed protein [Chlorella variabilis]|eukprot:XP_005845618.1 expressed protein [Chlorella variabilis]